MIGVVLKDKKVETILKNYKMEVFVSKLGMKIEFSLSYLPWFNRLNKRNHYSADRIVRKLIDKGSDITLEEAVARAAWMHDTNMMISEYNPVMLRIGKSAIYPG